MNKIMELEVNLGISLGELETLKSQQELYKNIDITKYLSSSADLKMAQQRLVSLEESTEKLAKQSTEYLRVC